MKVAGWISVCFVPNSRDEWFPEWSLGRTSNPSHNHMKTPNKGTNSMNPMNGFSDSVCDSRAVPNLWGSLENDPDVMVHQQLARLKFFENEVGCQGHSILEFGCGTGFNCDYLRQRGKASKVVGLDVSDSSVQYAKKRYHGVDFLVADGCDPQLNIETGSWDRVVAFEVLEHVPDMHAFLANIKRHLSADGRVFISTPNIAVFSLGYEPSPINRTHLKELTLLEFRDLLNAHFAHVQIFGQSFSKASLLEDWKTDVQRKIEQLQRGQRWQRQEPLRTKLRKLKIVDLAYRVPLFRGVWRWLRWQVWGQWERHRAIKARKYSYRDFVFQSHDMSEALWFCAVVANGSDR